jgi:hypothetical protein
MNHSIIVSLSLICCLGLTGCKSEKDTKSRPSKPVGNPAGLGDSQVLTAGSKVGRFVANDNGTVLDTKTRLMWASKDNGSNINWENAKSYCENYRGGGHADWRMPTHDELAGLYDAAESRPAACVASYSIQIATKLIDITCFASWASETQTGNDKQAALFFFNKGNWAWMYKSSNGGTRALPVRSGK